MYIKGITIVAILNNKIRVITHCFLWIWKPSAEYSLVFEHRENIGRWS